MQRNGEKITHLVSYWLDSEKVYEQVQVSMPFPRKLVRFSLLFSINWQSTRQDHHRNLPTKGSTKDKSHEVLDRLLLHHARLCQWDNHLPLEKNRLHLLFAFLFFKSASFLEEKQLVFLSLISYTLQLLNVSITIYPTTYPWQ